MLLSDHHGDQNHLHKTVTSMSQLNGVHAMVGTYELNTHTHPHIPTQTHIAPYPALLAPAS